MKNIKTIELTKQAFGLPSGTVLTRLTNDKPFEYKAEHIGEDYRYSNSVTISPASITNGNAKVVEYFEEYKRSAKHVISELTEKVSMLSAESEEYKRRYKVLADRAAAKRAEFQKKLDALELELEEDIIAGESAEWADEAMTVYYNLIDFINKLLK